MYNRDSFGNVFIMTGGTEREKDITYIHTYICRMGGVEIGEKWYSMGWDGMR